MIQFHSLEAFSIPVITQYIECF